MIKHYAFGDKNECPGWISLACCYCSAMEFLLNAKPVFSADKRMDVYVVSPKITTVLQTYLPNFITYLRVSLPVINIGIFLEVKKIPLHLKIISRVCKLDCLVKNGNKIMMAFHEPSCLVISHLS